MVRPLKLAEARQHTGRRMTVEEAAEFVSPHQPRQITRNQALALSLHTWNNTTTDWLRLEACLVLLNRKPAPPPKHSMFEDHRCWKCQDGAKACCEGNPARCDYPRARN